MSADESLKEREIERWLEEYELRRISSDMLDRTVTLVIAALGLIAALAWDETLRDIFEEFFGGRGTLTEKLIYAISITAIAVIVSVVLGKYAMKRRKKKFMRRR